MTTEVFTLYLSTSSHVTHKAPTQLRQPALSAAAETFRGNVKLYKMSSSFTYFVNLQKASDVLPKIDNC